MSWVARDNEFQILERFLRIFHLLGSVSLRIKTRTAVLTNKSVSPKLETDLRVSFETKKAIRDVESLREAAGHCTGRGGDDLG